MKRQGHIFRRGGQWVAVSDAGKPLGRYDDLPKAQARLRQVGGREISPVAKLRRTVDAAGLPLVHRIDRISWRVDDRPPKRADFAPPTTLDNNQIHVWGIATRVGVFDYEDDQALGGVFREYRPASEVLDAVSLETLRGVPFTIDHPDDDVTPDNARELTHGWVISVRADGPHVWTQIRIASRDALLAVQSGKLELSCGYMARLEDRQGVFDGERFDAVQREIRYNHLALVDTARAGPVARLKLDGLRIQRPQGQRP
jgi:hypothetical protein